MGNRVTPEGEGTPDQLRPDLPSYPHTQLPLLAIAMLLSEDKSSHLSHVILNHLKKSAQCRLTGDEARAFREI